VDETELLADLDRALAATQAVVSGVSAGQWTASTPCAEWDARGVLSHLVRGNLLFVAIIRDEPRPVPGTDHLGAHPLAAFQRAAAQLQATFRGPGVLQSVYEAPFGTAPGTAMVHVRIAENLVHAWDLARATGQPADFPDDVADRALARSRQRLTVRLDGPGAAFGAEVPVPPDAPAIDRLAGWLGRAV
jgi:uncharacterized protein (TIGR03086 family)